ncbi:MAG: bifunctional adenosylcobinamide kinase/adenosylcobinamide-phosphate guanylyltransferase [Oscillospiraceae bacterium]|nr:bifunctional adenosylcobinamide kinase/adenosylcobinamide-phosphate guanylyltransferase [Oscillospiraceae bacterium]
MEIQLIMGPNGSGKSLFAEQQAVESGDNRIYIATMVPQNEENHKRIEKHINQRSGKNFLTIEVPADLDKITVPADSVVLLEDASNLLGNEIFTKQQNCEKVLSDILSLAQCCSKLIIVTISGLTADGFDSETANYINQLNRLNSQLAEKADIVVEIIDGKPVKIK